MLWSRSPGALALSKVASSAGPTPESLGWRVDTDAPSFYPEHLVKSQQTIDPSKMSGLIATQKDIDPHHPAINHFDPGKANPVDLVRFGGETYISDGHHTLAGAQLARQRVRARIWHDPDDG